jgi:hypothetical protein
VHRRTEASEPVAVSFRTYLVIAHLPAA